MKLTSETTNLETITVEDLLEKSEFKGETVVVHNGKIEG